MVNISRTSRSTLSRSPFSNVHIPAHLAITVASSSVLLPANGCHAPLPTLHQLAPNFTSIYNSRQKLMPRIISCSSSATTFKWTRFTIPSTSICTSSAPNTRQRAAVTDRISVPSGVTRAENLLAMLGPAIVIIEPRSNSALYLSPPSEIIKSRAERRVKAVDARVRHFERAYRIDVRRSERFSETGRVGNRPNRRAHSPRKHAKTDGRGAENFIETG